MNMRRFLAAMLAVVMLIAMVPAKAQAAEGDTTYGSGQLYLDKTAILEDDGTYTIQLEAFATGNPVTTSYITGKPLDVVLVIDQSGSIYNDDYADEIQEAVEVFISQLVENGKTIGKTHRVAVTGFSCGLWETGFTHSMGDEKHNYAVNLPLADGSYAQLWTNTGIFLNDGTFKSYQTFEFEEVEPAREELVKTDMPVGSYRGTRNVWQDVDGFFTADGEQIQVRVTRTYNSGYKYTWQFQTKSEKALSFNVTNKDATNATVNGQETYTKTVTGGLPAYSSSNDPYHVFYGSYTHPVNGGTENREFPLYFVDDTKTWPGKTVRRAIYRRSDGKFYYDFRTSNGHNENTNIGHIEVPDMDTRKVYKINYGTYNASTGMFEGGYLTEDDYKNTFMNVTDGAAGGGNVTAALNKIASGLGASGATRTSVGMEMARKILKHNPLTEADRAEGRERVVIVFTDGVPGQSPFEIDEANAAIAEAAKIKAMVGTDENVSVYALGLFKANVAAALDTEVFMNGLSSNYPTAEKYEDVYATSYTYTASNNFNLRNYRYNTNWTTVSDSYAKDINGNYGELQVRRINSTWEFRTVAGVEVQLTVSGSTVASGIYTRSAGSSDYTDAGTPREDGGKYYAMTTNADDLVNMFPYIVTESTSTSLDSVFLTTGSILRDIMGEGFLLTGETTISAYTEEGTWTSVPNTNHTQGTIEWSGNKVQHCEPMHIEDPKTLTKPDITDPIQVYNTNPGPNNDNVGGNFYETASGELNLAAPPTIDITGFDYNAQYLAVNHPGQRLLVTITGVEAQAEKVAYDENDLTNHLQSGLWSPMDENDRTRTLVASFPMPNTTFTEALYVLDYAKPMEIPLRDLKLTTAYSLGVDNPHSLAVVEGMNYFDPENPNTEIQTGYFKSARPGSGETVPEATLPGGGTAVIDRIVITRDCADMICLQGSDTSLTVAASNTHGTEMRYQWYSCTDAEGNGAVAIEGATSATYQVSTNNCDVYYYFCEISADEVESVRSSVATVRVHKFMIARDCADMVGFVNEDVPLSVEIAAVPEFVLNYQWYVCDDAEGNGAVAIDGATESVYHASTSENGIHYYFCEIKGQPTLGTSNDPALGEETLRSSVAAVTVRIQNGKVTLENGKVTYHPLTTNWDGYDTFYVFGDTADEGVLSHSANDVYDNLWSRVKVLPANNVYYEDSFIQAENGVTVGIEYSGTWSTVNSEETPNQNEEIPESGETNYGDSPVYDEDMPFGGVHGWEDYLVDDTGFSDGSAHKTELTDTNKTATATFTFTGTGVDIYSYTDLVQGAIMANIYRGDHVPTTAEMLADSSLRPLYSVIMDNFSISSDGYYQIPTLSLHEKNVNKTDAEGNTVTVQEPLEHGTYTVKLTVVAKTDDADDDGVKTRRYTYHLDGIRIYNPIQNLEGDETVKKAYGEEELNASFVEVRDILLDKTNIDANGGMLGGVVFLDQLPNGNNTPDLGEEGAVGVENEEIGLYECYGPKNEVYLASAQSIAFVPKAGMHYYVGLKSPTGEKVCVSILKDGNDQLLEIDHTTDLYYEVTPYDDGVVVIQNAGMDEEYNEFDNLLSVTKIKVTGPDGTEVEPADFFEPVDQPTMLRMVRTLREEAAAEPEIPEDTEPTEPTGPEVDIENPTEPSEPEAPGEDDKNGYDYLWKLIGGIFDLIRGIIFG